MLRSGLARSIKSSCGLKAAPGLFVSGKALEPPTMGAYQNIRDQDGGESNAAGSKQDQAGACSSGG